MTLGGIQISGRWRRGWCPSVAKSLSSKHVLRPLAPVLCLLLLLIYSLGDRLRNFVTGIFIPQYHYPYAVALGFAQVLVSILFLNLLHALGLVPLQRYSRHLGERLLVPTICKSLQDVVSMWAQASGLHAGLYSLSLPLLPAVTAGFCFCLKLESPLSPHVSAMLSILSGTSFVITGVQGLAAVEPLEYLYAPLALLLHGLSLAWLAKVSEAERHNQAASQASMFDIYYAQLVGQSWVLGLLCLLHPDGPRQVWSHSSWRSLLFHGYLLAILLLGMVLNFLLGALALMVSPLAAAALHSAKPLVQPFLYLL